MAAEGRLLDGAVVVDDAREAGRLYDKGAFGEPQSGGSLRVSLVEAAFLVAEGRLRVKGETAASLVAEGARREPGFEVLYLVHRELRGRGLALRRGEGPRFLVFPRGAQPGRDPATETVLALSERAPLAPGRLLREADEAAAKGRALLLALVDEEADVTYYKVKAHEPKGAAAEPPAPSAAATALALADRVLVPDPPEALAKHGYGRPVGAGLQVPHVEALHLARLGWLAPDVGEDALRAMARARDPDFDLKEPVWRDLRARGLLVRTGFKFGTHFRAYRKAADTEHAPYLVHALPADAEESAPEVAGFVRLAHAVRKTMLFALVDAGRVRYVAFERTRP